MANLETKAYAEAIKQARKLLDKGIFVSPEDFVKMKQDILETLKENNGTN